MNNDFNDLLQDALDKPYEEKINLTKEAVDKLYNVLITNNNMLKIFGYFIKLDNIIAFDEIQLLIDTMGLTISGQQLNLYFKDMDFEEAENRVFYFKAALDDENVNDLLMIGLMVCASDGILTSDEQAALDELFHN